MKVVDKTHTKNLKLKIEAVTKIDTFFTKCQYKTEKPKNIEIFGIISLEI